MTNIGIGYDNILPDADTFAANNENTENPASNLLLDPPSIYYESLNGTVQVTASFSTGQQVSFFSIINHNLPSDTVCNIQTSDNGFQTYDQIDLTYHAESMIHIADPPVTKKDFRFNFTCTDPDYIVKIGHLSLSQFLLFPDRILDPVGKTFIRDITVIKPKCGGITRITKSKYWEYTLRFEKVKESNYLQILDALGGDRAKCLVLDKTTQKVLQGNDSGDIPTEDISTLNDFQIKFTQNPLEIK
jgi:hypothetical protein